VSVHGRFIHLDKITEEPVAKPTHKIHLGRFLILWKGGLLKTDLYLDPTFDFIETQVKTQFLLTGENYD